MALPAAERIWLQAEAAGFLPTAFETAPAHLETGGEVILTLERGVVARGRVEDREGRPLEGARLELLTREGSRPPVYRPGRTEGVAASGADGAFELAGLRAGASYRLRVRRAGFAGRELDLEAQAAPKGAQLVIRLSPGAGVAGQVLDPTGQPITGASLLVAGRGHGRRGKNEASLRRVPPRASTDSGGRFELGDLAPGESFDLFFHRPGFTAVWLEGVEVPADGLMVILEPTGRLRGRVVDGSGEPIDGATVESIWLATLSGTAHRQPTGEAVHSSALTDLAGRFELEHLRSGMVRIHVSADGFVPSKPLEVEVPERGEVRELQLALERGGLLEGRILDNAGEPVEQAHVSDGLVAALSDSEGAFRVAGLPVGMAEIVISHPRYDDLLRKVEIEPGRNLLDATFEAGYRVDGRVVDEDGVPVPDAQVRLDLDRPGSPRQLESLAGLDGGFALTRVANGRYRVQAERAGFAPSRLEETVRVDGEDVAGLELVLERGIAIRGEILGLNAEELPRVRVEARSGPRLARSTWVNPEGRFSLEDLGAGGWIVSASLDGGRRQVEERVYLESGSGVVHLDLELGDGFEISGEVRYRGEVLAGARLSLTHLQQSADRSAITDPHGTFRLADLPAGRYRLGLTHARDHLVHSEIVEVHGPRHLLIDLETVVLRGRVVGLEDHQPIRDAVVELRRLAVNPAETPFRATAGSDDRGAWELPRVAPGSYRLAARKDGFAEASRSVEIQPGLDVSGLDLALPPTQGLDLDVRLASGGIPAVVHVQVISADGEVRVAESRSVDSSGRARLQTVPAGDWTVRVGAPSTAVTSVRVTSPGSPAPVVLQAAATLSVRVPELFTSGLHAELQVFGAAAQAFYGLDSAGRIRRLWPVVDGRVVVHGVPTGTWQLRVASKEGQVWWGATTLRAPGLVEIEIR
ncbi:MAG: carboxypeptidase-like regulatory domain-containing protein [Holophagales bacterium]|nr:carboxypeptidase-like regulatory domain-containing protein [Holophagales bacterium]